MKIVIADVDVDGFVSFKCDFGGGIGVWASNKYTPSIGDEFHCEIDLDIELSDINISVIEYCEAAIKYIDDFNYIYCCVDSLDSETITIRLGNNIIMIEYEGYDLSKGEFIILKCAPLDFHVYAHDYFK